LYLKIKNIFNAQIKHIRTDNGIEFSNHHFNNFGVYNGIDHQFTMQQNGRAELFNGTLILASKSILNDSKLNH